ncbi:MAG: P-II family nitrogen regulator [Elusimicrobia bacterium]|nr:P-II family nitrogen regulator [Elusimicrobiota bacterium]
MKEIKAIIQTPVLEKVLRALRAMKGLPGCTVSHVRGYQRSDGVSDEGLLESAERTKLEIVVQDVDANKVVQAIAKNAHTGSPGDGKIFVIACLDALQIRTGERGEAVL